MISYMLLLYHNGFSSCQHYMLSKMEKFILENTKISKRTYGSKKKDEWTISSDKFIEYGIADEIVSDVDILI